MTGPLTPGEDVALFIDWENFKISLATGRRHPNVSALKEEVSNLGRVVVAKAYADWVTRAPELRGASQFINDPPALYAAGIEPVYVPTRLSWGGANPETVRHTRVKNSVDVKMTADCIECAHSYPNIGTFVLVSGDSDFIHVMNTLRTMGKRVVIIGVSWATSRRLVDQSDGLILYDVDVDPVLPSEPASEPVTAGNGPATITSAAATPALTPANSGRHPRLELSEVIKEIEEIVRSERAAGGTPLLTSIKQRVMRRFPNFDEKQLGFSGFKKLMARVAQEGNIKLVTAGLVDWATMANEDVATDDQAPSDDPEVIGEEPLEIKESKPRRRFPFRFGSGRAKDEEPPPAESLLDSEVEETPPDSFQETQDDKQAAAEITGFSSAEPAPPVISAYTPAEPAPPESPVKEFAASETVSAMSPELETMLAEGIAGLSLPEGTGDGQDPKRVSDLIIMADTLEHREGISHVAFNFLVGEVCQALEEGLKAHYGEITQRWASVYSRGYVSKMFRGLSSGNVFTRGWHSWRDETSGHNRRRRTFNLERSHPIVVQVLKDQWALGDTGEGNEPAATEPGISADRDDGARAVGDWEAGFTGDTPTIPELVEDAEADGDGEEQSDAGFFNRLFSPKS